MDTTQSAESINLNLDFNSFTGIDANSIINIKNNLIVADNLRSDIGSQTYVKINEIITEYRKIIQPNAIPKMSDYIIGYIMPMCYGKATLAPILNAAGIKCIDCDDLLLNDAYSKVLLDLALKTGHWDSFNNYNFSNAQNILDSHTYPQVILIHHSDTAVRLGIPSHNVYNAEYKSDKELIARLRGRQPDDVKFEYEKKILISNNSRFKADMYLRSTIDVIELKNVVNIQLQYYNDCFITNLISYAHVKFITRTHKPKIAHFNGNVMGSFRNVTLSGSIFMMMSLQFRTGLVKLKEFFSLLSNDPKPDIINAITFKQSELFALFSVTEMYLGSLRRHLLKSCGTSSLRQSFSYPKAGHLYWLLCSDNPIINMIGMLYCIIDITFNATVRYDVPRNHSYSYSGQAHSTIEYVECLLDGEHKHVRILDKLIKALTIGINVEYDSDSCLEDFYKFSRSHWSGGTIKHGFISDAIKYIENRPLESIKYNYFDQDANYELECNFALRNILQNISL